MRPFKGLSIQITTESGPLQLHHDPDDDASNDPYTCQRYVEAVTGATFAVKVSLHKSFPISSMGHDDVVKVVIIYDGQKPGWKQDLTKDTITRHWSEGEAAECTFEQIPNFCEETQQWKRGKTTFGALDMKETVDCETSVSDVKNLGRIQIKVQKLRRFLRSTPHPAVREAQKPITEVTEKILKGKAIANTVRLTDESPGEEPVIMHDYNPIHGDHDQPLIFNILYRSRRTLQMLGCIPRTPSPELQTAARISPATSREQKVRDLRAQLALLEGAGNVKAEGSDSRARLKREREATENTGARKRSRKSIETIDLTGD